MGRDLPVSHGLVEVGGCLNTSQAGFKHRPPRVRREPLPSGEWLEP